MAKKIFLASSSQLHSRPQPHPHILDVIDEATYDTEQPLEEFPNLGSVKLFLESSNAFRILKRDIEMWISPAAPSIEQAEEDGRKDSDDEASVPYHAIEKMRCKVSSWHNVWNVIHIVTGPWHTLPEVLDSIMGLFQPLLPEPVIPLGKTRLRWKCVSSMGRLLEIDAS